MIYQIPTLSWVDRRVLEEIEHLGERLKWYLHVPQRWYGPLRRTAMARSVQGSVAIEGYHASLDNVTSVMEGEDAAELGDETQAAITGYSDAMTFALAVAGDWPRIDQSLIRAMHFMIVRHDLGARPGNWRPGNVWVRDSAGEVVYDAPDRSELLGLMSELTRQLSVEEAPPLVKAAMAHLNLVLIHPFRDGNGRVARCLQTFVLASAGMREPVFSSIEGYLGNHTPSYYEALNETAAGEWSPQRSARAWIRFCLTAHFRQARTHLRRIEETEFLWGDCERAAETAGLPDRVIGALCDAARGTVLHRSLYRRITALSTAQEPSEPAATRDLAALTKAGWLEPSGSGRRRTYRATPRLRKLWDAIRARRREWLIEDPYVTFGQQRMPT